MPDKRTYADRKEYLIKAVSKRRKRIKEMAIEYKGGKCIFCGYNRCHSALDFHHIDAAGKEFGVSLDGLTRSWERTKNELDKCVLVCANCHREIHAGMLQPSEVIRKGKWGELREVLKKENPEPSLMNGIKVIKKVQRLEVRNQSNKLHKRPTS